MTMVAFPKDEWYTYFPERVGASDEESNAPAFDVPEALMATYEKAYSDLVAAQEALLRHVGIIKP